MLKQQIPYGNMFTFTVEFLQTGKHGELSEQIFSIIDSSVSKVYKLKDVLREALSNAVKYGITVYDSIYVTLAVKHKYKLATFDQKHKQKLEQQNLNIVYIPK